MADKMITTYNSHQSPTTDDKFFMVGASEEYLINYDLLASAILDKLTTKTYSGLNNSTVISALQATSYSAVLSASTYNDKAAALAALDSYANTFGGSVRIVGYISTANSNLLGLSNTSHYFDFYVNSASYRMLVARPVNGNTIYQLAKQGGTWGTTWVQLAKQSDVQNLTALTQGRQYGSIAAMYTELVSLLAVNQAVWCTATGDLIASLTNSEITKVCRVVVIKADSTVLDYMLFAPGSNAIYIGRINSTSSITNRNRFALRSDVAGIIWSADTEVKVTTSLTSHVASSANGIYYRWSTASDATAVGAPSAHAYHYLIVKVNSSAAIIQAHRMTTDGDEFYIKQLYGGNWASAWTQIANQSDIDTINSTLTDLTGTQSSSVSNTNFNTLTTTGLYQIGDLSTMTNGPSATGYGSLEVIKTRTYILQRFVHMSATAYSTEYFRVSVDSGSNWRSWHLGALPAVTSITSSASAFKSVASTYVSSTTMAAYKIGRMVFLWAQMASTSTSAPAETDLAVLPDAFKPVSEWAAIGEITSGTSANEARNLLIRTDGAIRIHNYAMPASTWLRFSVAYISAS